MDTETANKEQSVIAKLLSLAVLAEQAARLPFIVRWFVLFWLRAAEARTYSYLDQRAAEFDMHIGPMPAGSDFFSRREALRLAYCFRAFAQALEELQAMDGRRPVWSVARPMPSCTEPAPPFPSNRDAIRRDRHLHCGLDDDKLAQFSRALDAASAAMRAVRLDSS